MKDKALNFEKLNKTHNAGWKTVELDKEIEFDLENSPLEIMTDSIVGGEEKVVVRFLDSLGNGAGGVSIEFKSNPGYRFRYCDTSSHDISKELPSGSEKIWRVTLTRTSPDAIARRIVIHCNEVEVVNVLMSDSTCLHTDWEAYSELKVKKIVFHAASDTASDYFRPRPGGKRNIRQNRITIKHGIFGEWSQISTNQKRESIVFLLHIS